MIICKEPRSILKIILTGLFNLKQPVYNQFASEY